MVIGPLSEDGISPRLRNLTAHFRGEVSDVTGARLMTERFLDDLTLHVPPAAMESQDDILLTVTELAANAVQYAPGPFVLCVRRTYDGMHVSVRDTNPAPPAPRPFDPARSTGGIGWHLIQALSRQVSVVHDPGGKEIHVFLPW